MAINTIFTHGFGNGTYNGTVAEVVTFGYSIGEELIQGTTIRLTPRPSDHLMMPIARRRSRVPNPTKRKMMINRS